MTDRLDDAYEQCERITRYEAKNFYYAFRTLPKRKRDAIYATYAFCRICDDIADGNLHVTEKQNRFSQIRKMLLEGKPNSPENHIFTALNDTKSFFNIPNHHFELVLEGVEMDLTQTRFDTFEDLRGYCYKVASSVGLICIEVFGYDDPIAKEYAVDMGLAMQITNILRDLGEDAKRGRIYIPKNEMNSFGYTEQELMAGIVNESFRNLMKFQVHRARRYFSRSRKLIPLLAPRSRACFWVLHALYNRILDHIERADFDVFLVPIKLSRIEKFTLMVSLWVLSLLPVGLLQKRR